MNSNTTLVSINRNVKNNAWGKPTNSNTTLVSINPNGLFIATATLAIQIQLLFLLILY